MLPALNTITAAQSNSTQNTMEALTKLLNYCTSHPNATVQYHASNMILWTDSDASYLSAPKGRSQMGGFHFLSDKPNKVTTGPTAKGPTMNGAILVACTTMREVMSSATEAELGALFHNGKAAALIRTTLEELGHPKPPTPLQTDNTTAIGIASNNIKQKRSKAMDMRFYWIQDRVCQGQFHIYWKPGKANKADYFTKHHPASHHCIMQSSYIHKAHNPN